MIKENARRTNVVWSFENRCLKDSLIDVFREEDVDAIRLTSDTGDMAGLISFVTRLNREMRSEKKTTPVLVDILSKARAVLMNLKEPLEVQYGEKLTISPISGAGRFTVATDDWSSLFRMGANVFFGNGSVLANPVEVSKDVVTLEVVQGGMLYPEIEVHVPKTRRAPTFEDIKATELQALLDCEVDAFVVPAFETPKDLERLHEMLRSRRQNAPWIIMKVASEKVYESLRDYLPFVRGVLISRVELAMTMDPARLPLVTKEIIQLCNDHAKIVLVASEILASMRHNATPTRAEVSDIANAVLDGADGVVLSEDLPHGDYARRGLQLACKTVEEIESKESSHKLNWIKHMPKIADELAAITYTAYRTAQRNHAKAIVCITKQGNTAALLASFRAAIPIIAVTMAPEVQRQLTLVRGVWSILLQDAPNIDEVLPIINDRLINEQWLKSGDKFVFVSVTLSSIGKTASNLFTIQTAR